MTTRSLFITVISLFSLHVMRAEKRMGYVAPAFQIELDDTEWTFDTNAPTFWMVNGYLKFQGTTFSHRSTGLTLTVKALRLPEPFRFDQMDSLTDRSFRKEYKNLYSLYNADYYQRIYQLYFEEGYVVDLTCNKKIADPEFDQLIKTFVDRFTCIGAPALDRIAGYPLSASANEDSLRTIRRAAFFNQRPEMKDKAYIDHYVLMDKSEQFTFTRWEKEMMKESFMLYTEEDMALADGQVCVPDNVQWLEPFMPNHHFNLSADSYKSLRRYIHRKYPEMEYAVERINRKDNKGVGFLIHNEDTARFFMVHRHPKTKAISSYSYTIARQEGLGYEGAVMLEGKPNPKVWSFLPIDYKSLTFLVEEKVYDATRADQPTFSKMSFHSAAFPMNQPMVFSTPKMNKTYAHAFYFAEYEHRIYKALEAVSSGNADKSDMDIHDMGVLFSQPDTSVAPEECILRGPIVFTDYDNDQDPELSMVYVSAGKILSLETFELQSDGIAQVPNAKMWPIITKRKAVYQMLSFSLQSDLLQQAIEADLYAYDEVMGVAADYGAYGGYPGEDMEMDVALPVEVMMEPPMQTEKPQDFERKAQYKGGEQAMKKFIATNLKTPAETKTNVTVYVYCNVLLDGRLAIQKTVNSNGLNDVYTAEARRIIELMPAWDPAFIMGRPAYDQVVIPFEFKKNE